MRETVLSNMSTATDRLKKMLQASPVKIKGAGLEETPFQRLLVEDEKNKPQRKLDYLLGIDRVSHILFIYDDAIFRLKRSLCSTRRHRTERRISIVVWSEL